MKGIRSLIKAVILGLKFFVVLKNVSHFNFSLLKYLKLTGKFGYDNRTEEKRREEKRREERIVIFLTKFSRQEN
jgi:hypothetical protein